MAIQRFKFNHQIKSTPVRVINEDGEQLGVMPLSEALNMAGDAETDLVEIAPQAQPPVVKLIDYSKFKYQQQKAEQLQKKNAKKSELKTIRLSVRISEHDMSIKAKQVQEFLTEGDMVRVEVRMRGREQAHPELASKAADIFLSKITVPHRLEVPTKRMGNTVSLTIAPTK